MKISTVGVNLTQKKKDDVYSEIKHCLRDVLKQNQEITEVVIKVATTKTT